MCVHVCVCLCVCVRAHVHVKPRYYPVDVCIFNIGLSSGTIFILFLECFFTVDPI